jgi:co-chaperonin GroES (HSP10)
MDVQVMPKGDRVLVKAAPAEIKTKGGILIPTQAQKKPTLGVNYGVHTAPVFSEPGCKH